jgi:hypothetical protein
MGSRVLCTMFLLSAALVGCGAEATSKGQAEIAQKAEGLTQSTPTRSTPTQSTLDSSMIPPWADNGDAGKACCYVWCSDRYTWVGPFTSVPYGSCNEWASYYCSTRKASVKGAKWDNC